MRGRYRLFFFNYVHSIQGSRATEGKELVNDMWGMDVRGRIGNGHYVDP